MASNIKHGYKGRTGAIMDYLLAGNELSSHKAAKVFEDPVELNLRNKISIFKKDNWPIDDREEINQDGHKFKVWFIDFSRLSNE